MKVTNKDMIQSYILTAAKYDYSVYEKRILYRLIELMQQYTQGVQLNQKYTITKTLFNDIDISMPISAFLKNEKDFNHTRAKEALLSLNKKVIEYEDSERWGAFNLIERPEVYKTGDFISFRVSPTIAKAFLDFSKGYSKYELETAMSFESVYAMRFYELLSGQKKSITYTIESLKIMFKLENKYKLNTDFIRKVIDIAKKELDKKSPFSFEYTLIKRGRSFHSISFKPISHSQNRDVVLEAKRLKKQVSVRHDLDVIIVKYLKENYIFSDDGVKNNIEILKEAQSKMDLLYFLSEQKINASKKSNPQGWIIGAIKNKLNPKPIEKNTAKRGKQEIKSAKIEGGKTIDLEDMIREVTNQKTV
jgi:plasmid replication initiation protein